MLKKIIKNSYSIDSIVGSSSKVKGVFETSGPLRIDGKFSGVIISTDMVYVGEKSISECDIIAKEVVIGGTVKGNIYADSNVIALKTAEIIGDIYTSNIKIDDGVIFDGQCQILSKDEIKKLLKQEIESHA